VGRSPGLATSSSPTIRRTSAKPPPATVATICLSHRRSGGFIGGDTRAIGRSAAASGATDFIEGSSGGCIHPPVAGRIARR